ncbi:hypothetical protein [Sulfuriroseicoccus oceanibius]|uniref:Uncharacterized protein n=1 Tax=Sulfuriroseicoccus oceanibius TaxID=2707525 RepID=A0A6B3LGB9_9BACT|nr:hypothetical protein [Sulfuriroseicoccus oceanibius]QQL45189.1 hypothetical protein G3M56_000960 [Sulfuriroseicoccus oceanibius]
MKRLIVLVVAFWSWCGVAAADSLAEASRFCSVDEGRALLGVEDEYMRCWSRFDTESRVGKAGGTQQEWRAFAAEQVLPWSVRDRERIGAILKKMDEEAALRGWTSLPIPDRIRFVKTSMREEGGAAGYTRQDYIVLTARLDEMSDARLEHLVAHEVFHVLSRNAEDFRRAMYGIIGFSMMPSIDYPEGLKERRITNPDAPQTDCYIELMRGGQEIKAMMVMYSEEDYRGGSFFEYLRIGFLVLDESLKPRMVDGKAEVLDVAEVGNFFEQVGRNTNYIIHPEEIMAENFVLALFDRTEVSDPRIVKAIQSALAK